MRCRYFVPTTELWSRAHSVAWWSQRGRGLRLENEAAAMVSQHYRPWPCSHPRPNPRPNRCPNPRPRPHPSLDPSFDPAQACASESGGVHFSYEGYIDHVTRTTIVGIIDPGEIFEKVHHRLELVSFAVSELTLSAIRSAVSSLEGEEYDAAAAAAAAAAAQAEAAATAAAQAREMVQTTSDARVAGINAKREAGRLQQLAEAERKKGRGKQNVEG